MSSSDAGFPPGITAGSLVKRAVSYVIDALPALLFAGAGIGVGSAVGRFDLFIVFTLIGSLLAVGWWLFMWWLQGSKGASVGQRAMGLELVGIENGRPIGFGRAVLRGVIFAAVSAISVAWIIMLVLMGLDPRRQGWHDLAARSVVIASRATGVTQPSRPGQNVAQPVSAPPASVAPVGLPPSLSGEPNPFAPGRLPADPAGFAAQSQFGQSQPVGPNQQPVQPQAQFETPGVTGANGPAPSHDPSFGKAPDEVASTRLLPVYGGQRRQPDQGWWVRLSDGRQIPVTSMVLLGRNPETRTGEAEAELVKISDPNRTVSKTHIAIAVDSHGLFVMDRGSTNGSALLTPSGAYEPCPPGQVVRVRENQVVSFGDHRFEVRRDAG